MPEIKYPKPFLTEVIARIDFASPVEDLANKLPNELSRVALTQFPILEPRDLVAQELSISPQGYEQKQTALKEWRFFGKQKEKSLTITSETIFLSQKQYDTFEKFKAEYIAVVAQLYRSFSDLQIRRLGLRYINNIRLDSGGPTDWTEYLNDNLLAIFNVPTNKEQIARAFQTLVMNFGDFNLTFQYGMHNKDFPAPIREKSFILDLDAYYQGPLESAGVAPLLDRFHKEIQTLFESSIKDPLRTQMGTKP
jgi:uncharacterized protein (TIGR04255 family)